MAVSFFAAIAQSFAVILLGYLFGRFRLIDPREARSITTLVGKLALPALLFRNLAILDLSQVSWPFLGSILTAKFIVFVLVVVLSLIITRKIGRAGLYGIFSTQSNDFALGLPIVQALYGNDETSGFKFSSYIYLFAPISLAIINPIGFFMLEYSKQSRHSRLTCRRIPFLLGKTFFYLIVNPIMFMTLLGLIVNVIISYWAHSSFPEWLDSFLELVGGAYAPCALFNIGLFMVGKLSKVTGYTIFVSALLIAAKSILLPLIGYMTVDLFLRHKFDNGTVESIASFGFLYCTFPTAPTVFIYASQYSIVVPIIASSIVFGTLVSAPIMYITARMVTIQWEDEDSYTDAVFATRLNASSISIVCLVWVFILFFLSKRYKSYAHTIVMHLMAAQLLECIGSILLNQLATKGIYWGYLFFAIFFIGVFSSRLWLIGLCIGLLALIKKGMYIANRIWWPMLITAWGVPILTTILLVSCSKPPDQEMNKSFMFGTPQLVISSGFLLLAFTLGVIIVVTIIMSVKKVPRQHKDDESSYLLSSGKNSGNSHGSLTVSTNTTNGEGGRVEIVSSTKSASPESDTIVPSHFYNYKFQGTGTLERDEAGKSLTPFLVLAIFLLFSCLVGILVVLWQLVDSSITGVLVAAVVLDNATNFGQGFFVMIVFGFEKHWFWLKVYKKLRSLFFKVEVVELPEENELPVAKVTLCNVFKNNYLGQCRDEIVSDKRFYFQSYDSVFTGIDLVDWLIDEGIVNSVDEAVDYGQTLLEGRVLVHVTREHNFHYESYFYKFTI